MNMNTDAVATQAYFNAHPAVARADIEAQATAAKMSLNEYCRVLMSFDAIRTIAVQYVGICISVIMHQQTGEVIMAEATRLVDEIWTSQNDATDGADVMAARILQQCCQLADTKLETFLEASENTKSN
tara:strand:+ start:2436 stop:2819 length:384 start_codon:yes stop_codon:yes gene_type:complete